MKGGGGEDSEDSGVTCLDDCDIVASEGPPNRRISIKQYWVIRQLFCFVNWTLEMDIPGIWQNFRSKLWFKIGDLSEILEMLMFFTNDDLNGSSFYTIL